VIDRLLRLGPGVVILRIYEQGYRRLTGRPIRRYAEIMPSLFVGGQHRRRGWHTMQSWHINAVVSLRREVDDQKLGVASDRYLHLPTRDNTPPSLDDLQRGVAFIKEVIEAGCSVYVHCGVGVGRAPTLAAAYMVSRGLSPIRSTTVNERSGRIIVNQSLVEVVVFQPTQNVNLQARYKCGEMQHIMNFGVHPTCNIRPG